MSMIDSLFFMSNQSTLVKRKTVIKMKPTRFFYLEFLLRYSTINWPFFIPRFQTEFTTRSPKYLLIEKEILENNTLSQINVRIQSITFLSSLSQGFSIDIEDATNKVVFKTILFLFQSFRT